jgi:HrpA-like RNA helicase
MSDFDCPQQGCPARTTGKCLEGFEPLEKCPYLASGGDVQRGETITSSPEFVDLPSGEALTQAQAAAVTRSGISKVVIVAGPYGSGKTTILTALFEAFLEAPFANFLFRGSKTLIGFERRCHLGREESTQPTPDTSHTSVREGVVFLHLDLALEERDATDHKNMLLSDISGELFKRLRDSRDAVQQIEALKRADHLCLVLDGEKIASRESRQVARNDSRSILRSILEAGVLSPQTVVDVVFTKWDLIIQSLTDSNSAEMLAFIADTKAVLSETASGYEIRFHEVAARPTSRLVPFAHGLPTLLRSWFTSATSRAQKPQVTLASAPMREIARFTEAVLASSRMEGDYDVRRL